MNSHRDPDTILAAWLDEGPTVLPDVTRRAIAAALPTTPQRRRSQWAPWRFTTMPFPLRAASAVLLAAAVIGGGIYALANLPDSGVTPTPSPSAISPSPLDTTSWTTFTSSINGFSARYPSDDTATPATRAGAMAEITAADESVFDRFEPGGAARYPRLLAVSTELRNGMTGDAWLAAYRQPVVDQFGEQCFPPRSAWEAVSVDGQSDGGLYTGCNYVEAMLFVEGRVYIFTVDMGLGGNPSEETRQLLRAFLSTVTFDPGGAAASPVEVRSAAFAVGIRLTVPSDWTGRIDTADQFSVYKPKSGDPGAPVVGIDVTMPANVYADPCLGPDGGLMTPPLGAAVDDLVAWLTAIPSLHATAPSPITIGGAAGQTFDDAFVSEGACQGGAALWPINGDVYVNFEGEDRRYAIVDVGGRRLVVAVTTIDDQLALYGPDAAAVLEAIVFSP